jgi:PmbA protein
MARVAPEDPYTGLADSDRLARAFPDLDVLDATIPSAAEMTEMALKIEDAARAVEGVSNFRGVGRLAAWCRHLAASPART